MYLLWRDETLYQIWTQSNNPRRSYCDFTVWPYDLEHVLCCARLWDNFHQVWPSTTYPYLNYSVFCCWYIMSSCDLDLWPVDLGSSWYIKSHAAKSVRNLSEIEQSPAELSIILRIFAHVMSRRDRDFWPLDLELLLHFGCHAFKFCTIFKRNRIIHVWVIDDLARFREWVRTA